MDGHSRSLGQTWRVTYHMYMPSSLKATTTFTHIMQMKQPGAGTSPLVVQSLRRVNGDLKKGSTTLIDVSRTGVDTFLADRLRPKWGIYRSLGDTSGSLRNCHLLLRDMKGYQVV